MVKRKALLIILCITLLLFTAVVIDAATGPSKPAKYKGLVLSSTKKVTAKREGPCAAYGCTPWHIAVGDKDAKKVYRCGCNAPSSLKKDKSVCFMSIFAAKKVGYKEMRCSR